MTNRVAIYAHWDKDSIIDGTDIYYLKCLLSVCQKIIFVTDNNLSAEELLKLEGITQYIVNGHHGEYDFGSYKKGFVFAENNNLLSNCDELLFINNSCFGPIYPFEKVFEIMDKKECDFWGIASNTYENIFHLQSFFLLFKKNIFETDLFKDFIHSITKQPTKMDIIANYELGLSTRLIKNGFKMAAYIENTDSTAIPSYQVVTEQSWPVWKKSLFVKIYYKWLLLIINSTKYNQSYPLELIKNFYTRIKPTFSFTKSLSELKKMIIRFHLKDGKIWFLNRWIKIK